MKFILLSILTILFFSAYCPAREPKIDEQKILFVTGNILSYGSQDILIDTPTRHTQRTTEKPVLVRQWKRLLLTQNTSLFEGNSGKVTVYDYSGNIMSTPTAYAGELQMLLLYKEKRIFLGQTSAHSIIGESYLLNSNGVLIKTIAQKPDTFQFKKSKDERLIWILSQMIKDRKPVTHVKTIDSRDGNTVQELDSFKPETININYKGKSYSITLDNPQLPG